MYEAKGGSLAPFAFSFDSKRGGLGSRSHWSSRSRNSGVITTKPAGSPAKPNHELLHTQSLMTDFDKLNLSKVSSPKPNTSSSFLKSRKSMPIRLTSSSTIFESNSQKPDLMTMDWLISNQICAVIEQGEKSVHLTRLGLQEFPQDLKDLQFVACLKQDNDYLDGLQVFLSENELKEIPKWFFELSAITALGLRNNQINILPHCIGKMSNLTEINVANNCFSFFPYELKLMGNLKVFVCHSNPLYSESDVQSHNDKQWKLRQSLGMACSLKEISARHVKNVRSRIAVCSQPNHNDEMKCSICSAEIHYSPWLTMLQVEDFLGSKKCPFQYFYCSQACFRKSDQAQQYLE